MKTLGSSVGVVDLHFHGAFGIDLMSASREKLDELCERLWSRGVAGFLATTLSAPPAELRAAVARLGEWITSRPRNSPGAIPLGLHLEGPFVNPGACGAHPPGAVRRLDFDELEQLREASRGTLRLLTLAPEQIDSAQLGRLAEWAKRHRIRLSAGHSRATEAQARLAFERGGFSGVTHAWNALSFHHREPGLLGAALGRANTHVELILDQVHVSPTIIRWTLGLHPQGTCFVSDCVPAAACPAGEWQAFGPLRVQNAGDACRLPSGELAGGAKLLSDAYRGWLNTESQATGTPIARLWKSSVRHLTVQPLEALDLKAGALKNRRVRWKSDPIAGVLPTPL